MYDTLGDGIQAAQKSMRFRGDFVNKYQNKLPGLKAASDVILASSKLARNIKKKVDNIAVLERALKPERRKIVNKVIEVATSKQLWPSQMRPTKDKDGNEIPRRKITVDADFKKLFDVILPLTPLIAIFVGFIPGCGPQILTATLYLNGHIPFSAEIGNAISNDGDALFPAIAICPKDAILATIYSAVPALIVAYSYFFFLEY